MATDQERRVQVVGDWPLSHAAKCVDPPAGCGEYARRAPNQTAVIIHKPGCPVKARERQEATAPVRAECMGTVPHGEHQFNGGMYCPGLTRPGEVTITFDSSDPVDIIRALREVIPRDVLRVVADAEILRGDQ